MHSVMSAPLPTERFYPSDGLSSASQSPSSSSSIPYSPYNGWQDFTQLGDYVPGAQYQYSLGGDSPGSSISSASDSHAQLWNTSFTSQEQQALRLAQAVQAPVLQHPTQSVPSMPGASMMPSIQSTSNYLPPSFDSPMPTRGGSHSIRQDPLRASMQFDQFLTSRPPTRSSVTSSSHSGSQLGQSSKGVIRSQPARPTGACARCRRLKMKCTFATPDASSCSRCTPGGYECVFPGRKPRSPGMRTVLRHQIREKDAEIDELLDRVNPPSAVATPLTIVPSRLVLTPSERIAHRDVLTWLERSAAQNHRAGGESRVKFDISSLDDTADSDSESDEDSFLDIASARGSSPSGSSRDRTQALPEDSTPAGLLATSSMMCKRSRLVVALPEGMHLAGEGGEGSTFFLPGPASNLNLRRLIVERHSAPEILLSGLVTIEDVHSLFQIYFQRINSFVVLLDENIHTPAAVLSRCPLLFTVVCAVASRFYDEKPEMYQMAIHFAKAAAANAVMDGWKTIETCQAFILLSVFGPPVKRMEEDRSWWYTGIAFRLASELNLGRTSSMSASDEREEREMLNKSRAWLICFLLDRCFSIQMGKPWMIPEDDSIRSASRWCSSSKYQSRHDVWLASMAELMSITSRFTAAVNPSFGNKSADPEHEDISTIQKVYTTELSDFSARFAERHAKDFHSNDSTTRMQMVLMQCIFHYCRLVVVSYGFQKELIKGSVKSDDESFTVCLQAASCVITATINGFAQSGFIRYCPEIVFAQCAYAATLLLRCLEPAASSALDAQQEKRIVVLVERLSTTWTSGELASDKKHCAKPYVRLLQRQLEPHTTRLLEAKKASSIVSVESPVQDMSYQNSPTSIPSGISIDSADHLQGWESTGYDFTRPGPAQSVPAYTTSWDEVYATSGKVQSHQRVEPHMGGSETDYMRAVLNFPDNAWYM